MTISIKHLDYIQNQPDYIIIKFNHVLVMFSFAKILLILRYLFWNDGNKYFNIISL
jgi:hypothetical protein